MREQKAHSGCEFCIRRTGPCQWLTRHQIMHYSRVMPLAGEQRYHASTSVFLNEVIKLAISLTMVWQWYGKA